DTDLLVVLAEHVRVVAGGILPGGHRVLGAAPVGAGGKVFASAGGVAAINRTGVRRAAERIGVREVVVGGQVLDHPGSRPVEVRGNRERTEAVLSAVGVDEPEELLLGRIEAIVADRTIAD